MFDSIYVKTKLPLNEDLKNLNAKQLKDLAIELREETIKNVAFKFMDNTSFSQALTRTIEGSVRGFVATKKQAEILSLRNRSFKEG